MTVSRLTGRQQEHVGDTRSRHQTLLYANLASAYAEPNREHSARDDAIAKHAQLISRDMAKVSTLDYLSVADRAALEQRLAPRYTRTPTLTLEAVISARQSNYLNALGVAPEDKWSWLRASVEIDRVTGAPAGVMAQEWLTGQRVPESMAWNGIDIGLSRGAYQEFASQTSGPDGGPTGFVDGAALIDAASRRPRARANAVPTPSDAGAVLADSSLASQDHEQTWGPGSDAPRNVREEIKKSM